jgi:uncharacterized membrane protein
MAAFAAAVFPSLPAEIPVHWNMAGRPDSTMARLPGAFLLPGLGLAIWVLFLVLPRFDRRRGPYDRFWESYWAVCGLILLFLFGAEVLVLGIALGWPIDVVQGLFFGAGILFVFVGRLLPRLSRNRWMGIRTPWTLASETVWKKTHRVGMHAFVVCGGALAAAALLPHPARLWVAGLAFGLTVSVPAAYSYVAWRHERG